MNVLLQNGQGCTISNNIVWIDSSWAGMPISVEGFKNLQIGPNLVYASGPSAIKHDQDLGTAQQNITVGDPGFVNPPGPEERTTFDFQLNSKDSPAVAKAAAPMPCEDSRRRQRETPATLGALEYFADPANAPVADTPNCYTLGTAPKGSNADTKGNTSSGGQAKTGSNTDTNRGTSSGGQVQTKAAEKQPDVVARAPQKNKPPTNITYELKVDEWSTCSKLCGGGMQFRTLACVSSKGQRTALSNCDVNKEEHPTFQKCNEIPCPSAVYEYSAWGPCSTPCGGGTQSRNVTCFVDGKAAEDAKCSMVIGSDTLEKPCNQKPCKKPTYWTETNWGSCSKPCGGVQTRPEPVCKCALNHTIQHKVVHLPAPHYQSLGYSPVHLDHATQAHQASRTIGTSVTAVLQAERGIESMLMRCKRECYRARKDQSISTNICW